MQWAWPAPLLIVILFAPESPWYFIRNDKPGDARKQLVRLTNKTEAELNGTVAQMLHTIRIEREITSGATYWDCFKGPDLRRTEVACMTFAGSFTWASPCLCTF